MGQLTFIDELLKKENNKDYIGVQIPIELFKQYITPNNKYQIRLNNYSNPNKRHYFFIPPGTTFERKSQLDMGFGLLGTARRSNGHIELLNTLYGYDLTEILKHEVNHLTNWGSSEHQNRYKTKQDLEQLGIKPRYH